MVKRKLIHLGNYLLRVYQAGYRGVKSNRGPVLMGLLDQVFLGCLLPRSRGVDSSGR